MQSIMEQLRADFLQARKSRDQLAANALQSLLARISNAEAVAVQTAGAANNAPAAGMHVGVGSTEVPRKMLAEEDIQRLIREEIGELSSALDSMAQLPDHAYAGELRQKIAILSKYR